MDWTMGGDPVRGIFLLFIYYYIFVFWFLSIPFHPQLLWIEIVDFLEILFFLLVAQTSVPLPSVWFVDCKFLPPFPVLAWSSLYKKLEEITDKMMAELSLGQLKLSDKVGLLIVCAS